MIPQENVTRVEVIDEQGRSYVKYLKPDQEVILAYQDKGRTLKVFITKKDKSVYESYLKFLKIKRSEQ
jgi:hypothetical protein